MRSRNSEELPSGRELIIATFHITRIHILRNKLQISVVPKENAPLSTRSAKI